LILNACFPEYLKYRFPPAIDTIASATTSCATPLTLVSTRTDDPENQTENMNYLHEVEGSL